MNVSEYTTENLSLASWVWIGEVRGPTLTEQGISYQGSASATHAKQVRPPSPKPKFEILQPLRQWLNTIEVCNPVMAHRLCKIIPSQCPFERDIKFFGRTLFHIPPLCKLNPLYEEVVGLRFRALCYLADECGEDISPYC